MLIQNKAETKIIASRLFATQFPDNHTLFDYVWEFLRSRPDINMDSVKVSADFCAIGTTDEMTMKMTVFAVICAKTFMKCPLVREEVLPRFKKVCEEYDKSPEYIDNIMITLDRILRCENNMIDCKEYKVTDSPSNVKSTTRPSSRSRPLDAGELAELQKFPWSKKIVTRSWSMLEVFRMINLCKDQDGPILLLGETGTGKGLIAEALHTYGNRAQKAFMSINCASFSQPLLESELFGHMKGAFTGADEKRSGLLETAGEGTLFLDEIDLTSKEFQSKLLRVLREKRFIPVGGTAEKKVNARIIAAAKPDLRVRVEQKVFLIDLFIRLNRFPIHVLPLRDRPDDIIPITMMLLDGSNLRLSSEVEMALINYSWPGNVGELENIIARLKLFAKNGTINSEHLRQAAFDTHEIIEGLGGDSQRTAYLIALQTAYHQLHKKQGCIKLAYDLLPIKHKPKSEKNYYWRINHIHHIEDAEWCSS